MYSKWDVKHFITHRMDFSRAHNLTRDLCNIQIRPTTYTTVTQKVSILPKSPSFITETTTTNHIISVASESGGSNEPTVPCRRIGVHKIYSTNLNYEKFRIEIKNMGLLAGEFKNTVTLLLPYFIRHLPLLLRTKVAPTRFLLLPLA